MPWMRHFSARIRVRSFWATPISEEPGMEDIANWLRTFIKDVPVQFIRSGEPYWSPVELDQNPFTQLFGR